MESGGAKREKNRKKAMVAPLVFILAILETFFNEEKKPPNGKDLFGGNVFKNSFIYLAGLFKTLSPNGALASNSFFDQKLSPQ